MTEVLVYSSTAKDRIAQASEFRVLKYTQMSDANKNRSKTRIYVRGLVTGMSAFESSISRFVLYWKVLWKEYVSGPLRLTPEPRIENSAFYKIVVYRHIVR